MLSESPIVFVWAPWPGGVLILVKGGTTDEYFVTITYQPETAKEPLEIAARVANKPNAVGVCLQTIAIPEGKLLKIRIAQLVGGVETIIE
jgi:hypothetical protein